jgi:acyl transferase domain-containing protein
MGCRFPAGPGRPDLQSPEAFWQFLLEGGEAVSEVPASRWPLERFYDPTPGTPGRMHCRHGAFLQAPDRFDPARFSISPREAQAMDPQHRLLLEVVHEALERAAVDPARLRGQSAGVYVGICTGDYAWRQLRGQAPDEGLDMYFATGTSFAMAAGRLAYVLGLQGPALAVDTACSSSLVAVDLACRSLRDRCTDLAVAAGVSLLLTPVNSLCFARSGMMAADGHCKTFDAAADGYVRGEGCGAVVLKRLADALAAGDPILAVLRGSGVNQDGASAGLTVPNGEAQAALIRRTLEQAQLSGDAIDVLEAHGTGTPLGDPIELKALAPIYGRRERGEPLRLGSLKTNLGHLEGAAGIAGLIKTVLMVQHGSIPPHLHLRQRTPYLNWDDWALQIPATAEPWPQPLEADPRPRRAAVSSFGFSGTNAHVLVEQAPGSLRPELPEPAPPLREQDWLLLSAGSDAALRQLAQELAAWLPQQPASAWPAICATSRRSRSGLPWRLALQAADARDAAERLASVPLQAVPPQPPAVAVALQEASTADHWQAWCRFGVAATAMVYGPRQEALAEALAGTPPQLRLWNVRGLSLDAISAVALGSSGSTSRPRAITNPTIES